MASPQTCYLCSVPVVASVPPGTVCHVWPVWPSCVTPWPPCPNTCTWPQYPRTCPWPHVLWDCVDTHLSIVSQWYYTILPVKVIQIATVITFTQNTQGSHHKTSKVSVIFHVYIETLPWSVLADILSLPLLCLLCTVYYMCAVHVISVCTVQFNTGLYRCIWYTSLPCVLYSLIQGCTVVSGTRHFHHYKPPHPWFNHHLRPSHTHEPYQREEVLFQYRGGGDCQLSTGGGGLGKVSLCMIRGGGH